MSSSAKGLRYSLGEVLMVDIFKSLSYYFFQI